MRVLVENSSWNNIGDGFYQFSLFNLLKNAFPTHEYAHLNAPTRRSFRAGGRFGSNILDFENFQDADLYVFSGPILNEYFIKDYGDLIQSLVKRGRRYALISVHGATATASIIKPFLKKFPPIFFSSRDRLTFNTFKDSVSPIYDGVCTASLVSLTCVVGDTVSNRPYITSSFYEGNEPAFKIVEDSPGNIIDATGIQQWRPRANWSLWRHAESILKSYPRKIGNFEVVRPVHDIGYKFSHLNFARSNSFLSYNPLIYLSLYKGTSLTVTNRLHAALPTLSFRKPAVYVGRTDRNGALDRLGLNDYQGKIVRIPESTIKMEYDGLVEAIRHAGL